MVQNFVYLLKRGYISERELLTYIRENVCVCLDVCVYVYLCVCFTKSELLSYVSHKSR